MREVFTSNVLRYQYSYSRTINVLICFINQFWKCLSNHKLILKIWVSYFWKINSDMRLIVKILSCVLVIHVPFSMHFAPFEIDLTFIKMSFISQMQRLDFICLIIYSWSSIFLLTLSIFLQTCIKLLNFNTHLSYWYFYSTLLLYNFNLYSLQS